MNKTGSAAKVKLNSFDDLFGDGQPQAGIEQVQEIALSELSHCLLLDDVWVENNLIGAKMYTIFKLGISSQSTAFLL